MVWLLADTETTGLDTDPNARMCEVAYIIVDDDLSIVRSGSSVLNPGCPIPPECSAVHGLTDRDVANAPSADEFFAEEFAGGELTGEVCLITHNAKFDAHFLRSYLPDNFYSMCTLKLARALYPNMPNHKLGTIKYALDLADGEDRFHSAEGDLNVLLAFVRRMSEEFGYSIHGLYALATTLRTTTHMPWGKYKGISLKTLKVTAPSYLNWLLSLDNLDDDLRASIQAL